MEYFIPACRGKRIDVCKGQKITVIDVEGGQVVDFFAEVNEHEFLSTGVTIDCNESLKLKVGDIIYTNLYRPMLEVVADEVGEHDLLHPCCRPEMYDFFYHNGTRHPRCHCCFLFIGVFSLCPKWILSETEGMERTARFATQGDFLFLATAAVQAFCSYCLDWVSNYHILHHCHSPSIGFRIALLCRFLCPSFLFASLGGIFIVAFLLPHRHSCRAMELSNIQDSFQLASPV